ncbi:MAG: hypothetical protein HY304_04855 [candidate division Zixibacteria bacterium]|nr:hypothetical protein [candidate division Zixibacteria bacterium]
MLRSAGRVIANMIVILSLATLALVSQAAAQDSTAMVHLQACDPARMKEYSLLVFGDTLVPRWITNDEHRCSTQVLRGNDMPCLNGWRSLCGIMPLPTLAESLGVWFYAICDTIWERECLCSAIPAGMAGFKMALFKPDAILDAPAQIIDPATVAFPPGCHQSGHNRPSVSSLEFLTRRGRPEGILSMTIDDESMGNHPHADARQAFWFWDGDSLRGIGSLGKHFYDVLGSESSYDFEGELTLSDSSDQNEIRCRYSRTFREEAEAWFGSLSDPAPVSIVIGSDGIRVEGIRFGPDDFRRTRNGLPVLVADRLFNGPSDPSCPPDFVGIAPLFRQATFLEPTQWSDSQSNFSEYFFRSNLTQGTIPSMRAWVERDSLAFEYVIHSSSMAAFWFDTDLAGDLDDTTLSSDERVYVVRPLAQGSPFIVRGYCVDETETGIQFRECDTATAQFRWLPEGLDICLHIARGQIGFRDTDGPAMCGFGVEVLYDDWKFPNLYPGSREVGPSGFRRMNPNSWATLVKAQRHDNIDERGVARRLELEQNRKKK